MWTCPKCGRDFKAVDQAHYCVPVSAVDDYIAQAPGEHQADLNRVRETIRAEAPEATECIKWQMPTFVQKENLIHFAHMKNHLGIYPGEEAVREFADRLAELGYKTSKGAIQFPWNKPIPYELIAEITRYRVKNVES